MKCTAKKIIIAGLLVPAALGAFAVGMGFTDIHIVRFPRKGKTRVACVGDSITYGCGNWCFNLKSYPTKLQQLLGRGYEVENFGMNDRSVQCDSDKPYTATSVYEKSLEFQPDIVVFALGINDSKCVNWKSAEKFKAEYQELLDVYKNLDSAPRIVLLAPPQCIPEKTVLLKNFNDSVNENVSIINGCINELGEKNGLKVIDMEPALHGESDYFCLDGIHFTEKAAEVTAKLVLDEIIKA